MVIKELYICAYGSLRDRSFTFSENLNILVGENEAGKSTLMSFISFMLYGPDEAALKYIHATVGECGGRMTVSSVKGDFLIERKVASSETSKKVLERFSLYLLPSMKETEVKGQPGDFILGVSRNFFMGTSFISQKGASLYDPEKTSDAVQNILLSANEKIDTGRALRKVDEVRKYFTLKRGRGGVIADAEDRLSALSNERFLSEQAKAELERIDNELSELKSRRSETLQVLDALKKEKEARRQMKRGEMLAEREKLSKELSDEEKAFDEAKRYVETNDAESARIRLRELDVKEKYVSTRLADAENDVCLAKKALSDAKAPNDDLYSDENERKIVMAYELSKKRAKTLKSRAVFGFAFAALCAAVAVVSAIMQYAIVCAAFALVLTMFLVVAFVTLDKKKKEENDLARALAPFGLDETATAHEITDVFAHARESISSYLELEKRKEEKTKRLSTLKEELTSCRDSIEKLLLLCGTDSADMPLSERIAVADTFFADVISRPVLLRERCRHIRERLALLDRQIASFGTSDTTASEPSPKFSAYDDDVISKNVERLSEEKEILAERISGVESSRDKVLSGIKPTDELDRLISDTKDEISKRKAQYSVVLLADEAIRYASENLRSSVTPNLIEIGDRLFAQITQEKYSRIGVDESLNPNGIGKDSILSSDALSYGTNEAMYIAFRLSLLLVLCRSELPLMLLDESFAHIDDKRTENTLRVLAQSGVQSLVFTCSEREVALAENADVIRL